MELDDHLRQMLKELGQAINESISGSGRVHESIRRIRDEGYNLYMVLDAKVGVNRKGAPRKRLEGAAAGSSSREDRAAFRIDVSDLRFLRSLGIDPTRKVRSRRVSVRRPARKSVSVRSRAPRAE
jgi:hypothetical protein